MTKVEHVICLALEALLKGKRDNGAKAAREQLTKVLEQSGYRMPENKTGW